MFQFVCLLFFSLTTNIAEFLLLKRHAPSLVLPLNRIEIVRCQFVVFPVVRFRLFYLDSASTYPPEKGYCNQMLYAMSLSLFALQTLSVDIEHVLNG